MPAGSFFAFASCINGLHCFGQLLLLASPLLARASSHFSSSFLRSACRAAFVCFLFELELPWGTMARVLGTYIALFIINWGLRMCMFRPMLHIYIYIYVYRIHSSKNDMQRQHACMQQFMHDTTNKATTTTYAANHDTTNIQPLHATLYICLWMAGG